MKHKHSEIIKAWADGATIQYNAGDGMWVDSTENNPAWRIESEYRIKPEPKPDIVKYLDISAGVGTTVYKIQSKLEFSGSYDNCVKLVFDGENPSILKSLEVIK